MGRRLALAAVGGLILAIGIAVGTRFASQDDENPAAITVTVTSASNTRDKKLASPGGRLTARYERTREGAVAAATAYVGALDGSAILDPARLRRTLEAVASSNSLPGLLRAYEQATSLTRERLGVRTTPEPVVIVRAAPAGYRIDGFTPEAATISIWRVGIVGSGATVKPRQSWRTEAVSLVWENGRWKVASFRSTPGPTPPLATAAAAASELFASIPQFEEFDGALP